MVDMAQLRIGSGPFGIPGSTPSFNNHTVDASTEGIGFLFPALDLNPITHIGFRYGARTGTPPTYIAAIESPVDTTGMPDGTVLGGGSPASGTFTPPADTTWDGTWQWIALDNAYTPMARGQWLFGTIRYSSGTIDGSNCSSFTSDMSSAISSNALPYSVRNTAGTWASQGAVPLGGFRTASTRYGHVVQSIYTTRSASTIGHRVALEFVMPNIMTSFTLPKFRFAGSIAGSSSGRTPILGLWSSAGALQHVTLDSDIGRATSTGFSLYDLPFDEAVLSTLTPGTTYYCGLEVADATNGGVLINGINVASSDDLLAHAGGTAWRLATYDGSSWTSVTTMRPFAEFMLGDVVASSGGGSGGGYPILMAGGIVR